MTELKKGRQIKKWPGRNGTHQQTRGGGLLEPAVLPRALFAEHKHLERGSKRHFSVTRRHLSPFIYRSIDLTPSSSPSFFGPVSPSSGTCFRSCCLSADWLARLSGGTGRRGGKVPEWEENTRMHPHLRRQDACNQQTQTRTCAAAHHTRHTHTHTHATQEGADEGTHFQSPPASGLPTLHLIKPLVRA